MTSVTPFWLHSSHSDAFIARDAPVMSANSVPMPSQKICMPPPVPVDSTTGEGAPVFAEKRSATACV